MLNPGKVVVKEHGWSYKCTVTDFGYIVLERWPSIIAEPSGVITDYDPETLLYPDGWEYNAISGKIHGTTYTDGVAHKRYIAVYKSDLSRWF